MLTAAQLDVLPEPILALYRALEDSVLEDMARGLAALTDPAISRAAWQMQRLTEAGAVYEAVLARLSRVTGTSEALLREMFEQAGVRALRFDDAIYRAAGLNPLPLNLSPAMAQVLRAGLEKTGGLMRNLTQTTAVAAQTDFIAAADLAYLQVVSGAFSYQDALRQGVTRLADGGLRVIHYASGRRDPLDVALRRTLLTGVNQTVGRLQEARADALGTDLVQTSAHIGARPSHAAWQGQVFSRRGRSDKYPSLVAATGYGTATGLCGINCRHSFFPFFEGLSAEHYTAAELDSYESKRVTYEGESMTVYEATQKQRALERKIRLWKREAGALGAAGLDNSIEIAKVRQWEARLKDFSRQTGLKRQPFREAVETRPTQSRVAEKSAITVSARTEKRIAKEQAVSAPGAGPMTEKDVKAALKDKLNDASFYSQNFETAYVYDSAGKLKLEISDGEEHTIDLSPYGKEAFVDTHFLHNHPLEFTLSEPDLYNATVANMASMTAVTKDGYYMMIRPPDGWPRYYETIKKVQQELKYSDRFMSDLLKYREGIFGNSPEQLNRACEKVWRKYAEISGATYVRRRRK